MKDSLFITSIIIGLIMATASLSWGAEERELITILQSDADVVKKCQACVELRTCGTVESVEVLALLLDEERVSHAARYALEGMPFPEAQAVLREAIVKTAGERKIVFINLAGLRRDKKAIELLIPLLSNKDADLADAAAMALGRIGGKQSLTALTLASKSTDPKIRTSASQALLQCAEYSLQAGDNSSAAAIYKQVAGADVCPAILNAAWRGQVLSDATQRSELVVGALLEGDILLQRVALKLVREIKDPQLLKACMKHWDSLSGEAQLAIVDAYVQCSDNVLDMLRTASLSTHLNVRIAAWQYRAQLGDSKVIPVLAAAACGAEPSEKQAAQATLGTLRGNNIDTEIVMYLRTADVPVKVVLIQALVERSATEIAPDLLAYAKDENRSVRIEALKALRSLASAKEISPLIGMLLHNNKELNYIHKALVTAARRCSLEQKTNQDILARREEAKAIEQQCALLEILGDLGQESALPILREALQHKSPQIQYAAINALSAWPNTKSLEDLLKIVRNSANKTHRVLALRGYIDIADSAADIPPAQKLKLYKGVVKSAETNTEKKQILAALSKIKTKEALNFAEEFLSDAALEREAAQAALTIAKELCETNPFDVRTVLVKVKDANIAENQKQQARKIIKEIDTERSYLLDWEVVGPYFQKDKSCTQLFDIPFGPEVKGEQVQWKPIPVSKYGSHIGYLDILRALNGGDQRVAYLRTNIKAPEAQKVVFEIFSDDGVKAWLNGKVIHANNTMRPIPTTPDLANATLQKGTNVLLLKVTQNNLPWGAIVRMHPAEN